MAFLVDRENPFQTLVLWSSATRQSRQIDLGEMSGADLLEVEQGGVESVLVVT